MELLAGERAQEMVPAEGEETSPRPDEGLGQVGHRDHEPHHLAVLDHDLEEADVQHHQVLLRQVPHLLLVQRRVPVDALVGLVHQPQHRHDVLLDVLLALEADLPVAATLGALGELRHQLRDHLRRGHLVDDVVGVLAVPFGLDQPDEPREVVVGDDRGVVLEALDLEPLGVLVVEAEGADDLRHPLGAGPSLDVREEGVHHLLVPRALEQREPRRLLLHVLVVAVIDDPHHPPHERAVLLRQHHRGVAVGERAVLLRVEVVPLVHVQRRHPQGVVLVEHFRQVDEPLQVTLVGDRQEADGHAIGLAVEGEAETYEAFRRGASGASPTRRGRRSAPATRRRGGAARP